MGGREELRDSDEAELKSDTKIRADSDYVSSRRPFRLSLGFSKVVHSLSIFVSETPRADYTGNPKLEAMTAVLIWMRTTRDKLKRFYNFPNSTSFNHPASIQEASHGSCL